MLNLYNVNKQKNTAATADKAGRPANYQRYVSPEGNLSGKELKWAMWYVKRKALLYRAFIVCLAVACVILWLYSLLRWGNYLIFGMEADKRLARDAAIFYDYTPWHPYISAQPPQIIGAEVFGGVGKIDAAAEVINPNKRFIAYFDYYFVFGEEKTPVQKGFLLPLESRPLSALGLDSALYYGSPVIVLENLVWRRVSAHQIGDVEAWQAERLNFAVSDFHFLRRGSIEGISAHAVQFQLTNHSPYGFVEAQFVVGLYYNQSLVGILPLNLFRFRSQEARQIDLRSFTPNLTVSEARVFPAIDIYDESLYMEPEG